MTTAEQTNIQAIDDSGAVSLGAEEIVNGRPARTVTLQEPIQRGEQTISKVHVRKPRGGELRGINLDEILKANTDSIMLVLPRVTHPTLVRQEVEALDPADLMMLGMALVSFFVPKAALQ